MNEMRRLMEMIEEGNNLPFSREEMAALAGHTRGVISIPQQRQRQDALNDQLRDLIPVATKLGMYDAADFLRKLLEK